MRKKLFTTGIALVSFLNMYAGGLLTNTNQNVAFLRNPARGASIEIDAVYSNPAGLAFLKGEGLFLSLNNQSAFQTRTITADFAPFAGFGGSAVKAFEGKAKAPFIPSLQAAYKTDRWVFSGSFAIVGGGGTAVFDNGLPSFESQVAGNLAAISSAARIPTDYALDSRLEGTQIIYGIQLGATYAIGDNLSAFLGGRANIVKNGYEGYLRNVQISAKDNLTNYFNTAAATANAAAASLQPAVAAGFGDMSMSQLVAAGAIPQAQLDQIAAGLGRTSEEVGTSTVNQVIGTFTGLAQQAAGAVAGINQLSALDMQLNCKQSGLGFTPIIGFDFRYDKLNVGLKYEFKTAMELTNKTTTNTTGVADFNDGAKTPYDIPALLTAGAQYDIIPQMTVSVGYHHFFDSDAKMANNKQQYINGGINEYLAGVEYRIDDMYLVSCGTQIARTGVTDNYQADLSYSLSTVSFGFGGAVNITKNIRINLAYFFTNYDKWTKKSDNYNGTGIAGTDTFSRTNQSFGIGLDYKF